MSLQLSYHPLTSVTRRSANATSQAKSVQFSGQSTKTLLHLWTERHLHVFSVGRRRVNGQNLPDDNGIRGEEADEKGSQRTISLQAGEPGTDTYSDC